MNINVLVVIPARGGSKGIPRKNLRSLDGKPLIHYAIKNAINSKYAPDVYVSSEDGEILSIAGKLGAKTLRRGNHDSEDLTTLDPVIYNALQDISHIENKKYDIVVTLQPTSPLLKTNSIDNAIMMLIENPKLDTVISAVDDTHLSWSKNDDSYMPNYKERLNRQLLPKNFKETGGFLITRARNVFINNRIGRKVTLAVVSDEESIDIDTFADWGLCEFYVKRKRIVFVVSGHNDIGLGHVYNTLLLANDFVEHEVFFLVDHKSQMAFDKIELKNYKVFKQSSDDISEDIIDLNPDIVINDKLDTQKSYIKKLKDNGIRVINFEDLGPGTKIADLTINAIYPEKEVVPNHYFGHKYFILRDEFILAERALIRPEVKTILLSFGGVDPNNYTQKVLLAIYEICRIKNITIKIVTGFGYSKFKSLESYPEVEIYHSVENISDYMLQADLIFTSAGRTVYEVASLGVPAVVLAQNERELTHFFANSEHGFINLGLGTLVENDRIVQVFHCLLESFEKRQYMAKLMANCNLSLGRSRVVSLIREVINS